MKEWSKSNELNSFNSFKGLLYADWYKSIREWKEGRILAPMAPVEASLDPIHACNLKCEHCFNGEEEITLDDFSTKKMKDLQIGENIFGIKNGKMISNKVLKVFNNGKTKEMYRFIFEDGDTFECTGEHRIFESRGRYKRAKYFKCGDYVKKAFRFNREISFNKEYKKGYIAGMALGDGCFWLSQNRNGSKSGRFRLFLDDEVAMEEFGKYCTDLDIKWHWGKHKYKGHKDYQKDKILIKKALWVTDDKNARKIRDLMDLDSINKSFKYGWIAGIFDAEGSNSGVIRISQFKIHIKDRITQQCLDLGYEIKIEKQGIRILGQMYDRYNFYLDHNIKIKRKFEKDFKRKICSKKKIIKIQKIIGNYTKYDIETETHNYLVKGVLVHNCNAASYLISDLKERKMSDFHMRNLIEFLGEWGVKAICFGGGGEPTLHPYLTRALYETKQCGMESSIATNGTLFNKELINSMAMNCRWVGVSVDASTRETYMIGRKLDCFDKAINNIASLVERINSLNTKCDVGFKYLIFEYNQHEIFEACKIAKKLGVKDFHARPADFSHQGMGDSKKKYNPYSVNEVLEQFEKCHELETEDFRVFTVVHKFDDSFKPRKDFSQCYASPCCIQLCADGNIYLCPDQRHQDFYKLGVHSPDPSDIKLAWGSRKHYDLVFKNGRKRCNTRCTFSPYCRQAEELFMKDTDPMCKNFI